ncbi:uncharacterized protein Dwil_GK27544 [Drosophila willistoni]|uniref:Uncharacterized protein n=2 Tax=Drosophila willistoni TaxID=7260 RepID=A0A0Q9X007_DROWI|nr:uncharacterized protein Dwil_GK27544 [Drosophila willistoni]
MGGIGHNSYATLDDLSGIGGPGITSRKHSSTKSRQGLRGQRQFAENVVETKLRRKRQMPLVAAEGVGGVAAIAPTNKRYDYYDEASSGGVHMPGLGLDLDDNLNLHKQSSFYAPSTSVANGHNDVDLPHQQQPALHGDAIDLMASKNSINVRLFMLKPEMLPCHDELSDPTELPLSRDLMDVRSNVGQDSPLNGQSSSNLVHSLERTLLLASALALLRLLRLQG